MPDRNQEIPAATDADPKASYFERAGYGLYIRMALLDEIMSSRAQPKVSPSLKKFSTAVLPHVSIYIYHIWNTKLTIVD